MRSSRCVFLSKPPRNPDRTQRMRADLVPRFGKTLRWAPRNRSKFVAAQETTSFLLSVRSSSFRVPRGVLVRGKCLCNRTKAPADPKGAKVPAPDLCTAAGDKRTVGHSITSSARASNDARIVRPSAFAVLLLLTGSDLAARSTGRSVGLTQASENLQRRRAGLQCGSTSAVLVIAGEHSCEVGVLPGDGIKKISGQPA